MAQLADLAVARIGGREVSLQSLLYTMKITHRLGAFRDALDSLVIQQAAERDGIAPSDAELQSAADGLRGAMGLHQAAATNAWLSDQGLSVDDLEAYLVRLVSARQLREKLTRDQIEAYFTEHRPAFDAARIARLAMPTEGLANEVAAQLTAGTASLAELSVRYPADPAAAPADGAGFTVRMKLDPALASAVFQARAGQVVGPVRTSGGGFEVARVEEVRRAELDGPTAALVGDLLFERWLQGERQRLELEVLLPGLISAA